MKNIILSLASLFVVGHLLAFSSTNTAEPPSLLAKILQDDPLPITITTDLEVLLQDNRDDEWQLGRLQYEKNGIAYDWKMDVRPRGKFRRMTCEFPPLKLELSKKALGKAGLAKQDDIKLVTHCLADSLLTSQLIFREYLAYKLYNEASLQSLRVQLVKVRYEDVEDRVEPIERWGILLEDIDELADRLQGEEIDQFSFKPGQLDTIQHTFIAIFQMMIGNTDWSINPVRNLKLIQQGERNSLVLVPYDFDFSAWVDAPYAAPRSDLGQQKLREPLFQGITESSAILRPVLKLFRSKRKAFFKVVEDFDLMTKAEKSILLRRLRNFYRITAEPQELLIYQATTM
ncbi:MAG: CotH kinase family protein [Saprospiraceae bacterium]|nr:CotH kinase family protein [Saprospiraceae bacterium]